MTNVLTLRDVRKSFGSLPVIDGISLTLAAGETVGILGASGCGKTTLLRLIARLEKVDAGNIDTNLQLPGPALGYLAADHQLLPWRTLLDNAALGLELQGIAKMSARDKAAMQLAQAGLGHAMGLYPRELSSGMKQRALLARMLTLSPQLLLLDEPTGNLDIVARQAMGSQVKNYVRQQNAAAIIVTHSVEEACAIADRVLIFSSHPARIATQIAIKADAPNIDIVHRSLVKAIGLPA